MAVLMNLLQAESAQILAVLLDAAVKGLVILAAAGVLAIILRRRTASLRHLVWSLALAAMLGLPALSAVLPGWQISILPWQVAPVVSALAGHQPAPILDAAPTNLATPRDSERISLPEANPDGVTTAATAVQHAHAAAPSHSPSSLSPSWQVPAVLVWLAGMLITGLPLVVGLVAILRRTRQAEPVPGDLAELLDDLRQRSRTRWPVRLLYTRSCEIPATWGSLRPVILLSTEAARWPIQRAQVVLLHELAHIRRMDWLTQFMVRIVRILYWFHPLVWLAARMQRVEAERSCDDAVLAEGLKPSEYARQLLDIVSGFRSTGYSSLAAIAMARRSSLEGRVLSILNLRQRRGRLTRPAVAFAMAAMTAIVLPVSIMQPTPASAQVGQDRTSPSAEALQVPPPVHAKDATAASTSQPSSVFFETILDLQACPSVSPDRLAEQMTADLLSDKWHAQDSEFASLTLRNPARAREARMPFHEQVATTHAQKKFLFDSSMCYMNIAGHDEETVTVDATVFVRSHASAEAALAYAEQIQVELAPSDDYVRLGEHVLKLKPKDIEEAGVLYTVKVPRRFGVDVRLRNGRLYVTGIAGEFTYYGGGILIGTNLAGRVWIEDTGGTILLANLPGPQPVHIDQLRGLTGLLNIAAPIQNSTVGAVYLDLRKTVPAGIDIDINRTNCANVVLGQGTVGTLDFACDGGILVHQPDGSVVQTPVLRQQLGSGGPSLSLKMTSSGKMNVWAGATLQTSSSSVQGGASSDSRANRG